MVRGEPRNINFFMSNLNEAVMRIECPKNNAEENN
jgi:hypothetical protein